MIAKAQGGCRQLGRLFEQGRVGLFRAVQGGQVLLKALLVRVFQQSENQRAQRGLEGLFVVGFDGHVLAENKQQASGDRLILFDVEQRAGRRADLWSGLLERAVARLWSRLAHKFESSWNPKTLTSQMPSSTRTRFRLARAWGESGAKKLRW
ncbi:MAG: hypothetical protein GY926_08715 [bacterium]|nr:hypothetical protein [bacterium]